MQTMITIGHLLYSRALIINALMLHESQKAPLETMNLVNILIIIITITKFGCLMFILMEFRLFFKEIIHFY